MLLKLSHFAFEHVFTVFVAPCSYVHVVCVKQHSGQPVPVALKLLQPVKPPGTATVSQLQMYQVSAMWQWYTVNHVTRSYVRSVRHWFVSGHVTAIYVYVKAVWFSLHDWLMDIGSYLLTQIAMLHKQLDLCASWASSGLKILAILCSECLRFALTYVQRWNFIFCVKNYFYEK